MTTNDPRHPRETLFCKGRVQVPLVVKPRNVQFGQIPRKGAAQHRKVVITRGDGGPLNLHLAPVKLQGLEAEMNEIEPGERYEIDITVTPPFQSGALRTALRLETGVAQAPRTTISVFATLAPRVKANPKALRVPRTRESDWERIIRLAWDDDKPHKIIGATINDPLLHVRVEDQNGEQHVVLQVPQDYTPRRGVRSLVIKTDDAEAREVKVRVAFAGVRAASRNKAATQRPSTLRRRSAEDSKTN